MHFKLHVKFITCLWALGLRALGLCQPDGHRPQRKGAFPMPPEQPWGDSPKKKQGEGAGDSGANMAIAVSAFGVFADSWKHFHFSLFWFQYSQKVSGSSPQPVCQMPLSGLNGSLSVSPALSTYGSDRSSHSCLSLHMSLPPGRRLFSPPDTEILSSLKSPVSFRRPPWATQAEADAPSFNSLFAPFIGHVWSLTAAIPVPATWAGHRTHSISFALP